MKILAIEKELSIALPEDFKKYRKRGSKNFMGFISKRIGKGVLFQG